MFLFGGNAFFLSCSAACFALLRTSCCCSGVSSAKIWRCSIRQYPSSIDDFWSGFSFSSLEGFLEEVVQRRICRLGIAPRSKLHNGTIDVMGENQSAT